MEEPEEPDEDDRRDRGIAEQQRASATAPVPNEQADRHEDGRCQDELFRLLSDPQLAATVTPGLTAELVRHLQDRAPRADSQQSAAHADLLAHLHAAVLAAAMAWWAQSRADLSAEELATTVWKTLRQ